MYVTVDIVRLFIRRLVLNEFRDLTKDDKIQLNDEWYNPEWEVGGPWYEVKENSVMLGTKYNPEIMRPMRRLVKENTDGAKISE